MTSRYKIINGRKAFLVSSADTKTGGRASLKGMKRQGLIKKGRVIKLSKKKAKYERANYGVYAL